MNNNYGAQQCINVMRGIVLNMNDLTINTLRCKLKIKFSKNPHYAYTEPLAFIIKNISANE